MISIDAEKDFDKSQHNFIILKNTQEIRHRREILQPHKRGM